ncbi:hypothetical protein QAD02_005057 [Eretmocerus hayati]|uniref:Uncharacterized protein n=1 Tax=Eretmocerus hayati TaxID=131215 RepID=A0ACC2NR88_9HYME|nr:hypothetical protein QAD02_005057 [Eretmocerus hayati]
MLSLLAKRQSRKGKGKPIADVYSSTFQLVLAIISTLRLLSASEIQPLSTSPLPSTTTNETYNISSGKPSETPPIAQLMWPSSTADTLIQDTIRQRRDAVPSSQEQSAQSSTPKQQSMRQARSGFLPDQGPVWPRSRLHPQDFELEESENLPPMIRAHYSPKADFITSGRPRSLYYESGGSRESRELVSLARTYDLDYEQQRLMQQEHQQRQHQSPVVRNIVSEHDIDVPLPRNNYNAFYPERYRTQRDYYYKSAPGGSVASSYAFNQYRDEEENYEPFGRYRPTPRTKRIIYYATLPEKKPMDASPYPRPHNPRGSDVQMEHDRNRMPVMNSIEMNRRPVRYPFDNPGYDNYVKRSSYYDRNRPVYEVGDPRFGERPTYRDRMRSDDRKLENSIAARSVDDQQRLPWPVQIGTEVNIKENERIPGRKIFGQSGTQYERYEGSRVKKTLETADRKEDADENHHDDHVENQNH